MDTQTNEKLERAIDRYVDGLDMDTVLSMVWSDMWEYYSRTASRDEVLDFIVSMQVTDKDVEQ